MSLDRCASGGRRTAGFTLLELLVVLGILAVAAIIATSLGGQRRANSLLRSAALELGAALRASRASAIRSNVEMTFIFDAAGRQYWVEGADSRQQLPDQLLAELVIPGAEQVGSAAGRFRFYPDGSSSGGQIVLRQGGSTAVVAVDWLTGNAQVKGDQ
jgi:general secretion pathway protein H